MKKGRGLRVGVIGAGTMGENHCRIIAGLSGAKLAGVTDTNLDRAKGIAVKYDALPYPSYQELLPQIDAAIIATPTDTHFDIANDVITAGKHLLVEKPLTKTSGEAYKLINLAKEKNLVFAAGLIERYNPCVDILVKLIKKDRLLGLDFKRLSPFPERITDSNVIFDMMIHDLDLLRVLVDDEIESIKAQGEKVRSDSLDRVVANIYFKSGLFARLEANRIFGIKTRKITASGEKRIYEADLISKRIYAKKPENLIPSVIPTEEQDQLTAELTDFIKAIKTGKNPKASAEDGYRALQLAEEIEKKCS